MKQELDMNMLGKVVGGQGSGTSTGNNNQMNNIIQELLANNKIICKTCKANKELRFKGMDAINKNYEFMCLCGQKSTYSKTDLENLYK